MKIDPEIDMAVDLDTENKRRSRRKFNRKSKIIPSSTSVLDEFSSLFADSVALDPSSFSLLKRPPDSPPAAAESPVSTLVPNPSPSPTSPRIKTVSPLFPIDGSSVRSKKFAPHCSIDSANLAIENGDAFRALFRVNPYNRSEAYCTVDGVPVDILIVGYVDQNRGVEGDTVAIKIFPPFCWPKMKGSNIRTYPYGRPFEPNDINSNNINEEGDGLKRILNFHPHKRPTGRVITIIDKSPRRSAVVGYLNSSESSSSENFFLFPSNPRLPKVIIPAWKLENSLRERLASLESQLVAAEIKEWSSMSDFPVGDVIRVFGCGSYFPAQIKAILFENAIRCDDFSSESLSSLPDLNWKIPYEELKRRKDIRSSCIFTIDPPSAFDLDDALSYEVTGDLIRIGVHVADVSYFVLPETPLDLEARSRATSVYFSRSKIPMLPPTLSEHLGSLKPGADRLAISIFWDFDRTGEILDRWIGRTVIRSCCQMSFDEVFNILNNNTVSLQIHGDFSPSTVHNSVRGLQVVAKSLRDKRFANGALSLNVPKIMFKFDSNGFPYDIASNHSGDSVFLVEEFMLLANKAAAEKISSTFPDRALLRRHPEPITRKLGDLEDFCLKNGFEFDSSNPQNSLSHLQNDDVLIHMASKSMQLAVYFSTGDLIEDPDQWRHFGLAAPVYTHFTSPLRRYPDIVVHRTLACVLDAEASASGSSSSELEEQSLMLRAAGIRHGVPEPESLSEICVQCNERRKAARNVVESTSRVSTWMVLRRREVMVTWARVISLGPRFMSVFLVRLGMERRICYDDVEGLQAEWLEYTGTVVLSFGSDRGCQDGNQGRSVDDFALVVIPDGGDAAEGDVVTAAAMPITLRALDVVAVAVHAVGGDFEPLDFGVRLFVSSYLHGVGSFPIFSV